MNTLSQLGLEPYQEQGYVLPYHTSRDVSLANLVGLLPGKDRTLPPMLLGAHYDSVPGTPGADDNASAIWVVLNTVSNLKPGELDRSVIVALFDAEEPPYFLDGLMGSTSFYAKQLKHSLHCTFIFDLVGHNVPVKGIEDLLFITGMESSKSLESVINGTEAGPVIRVVPVLNSYIGDMSDHHVFRLHDEPYLFFSCGRWEHYHMPTDTVDKLNFEKMEAISSYVRKLLIECDRAEFGKRGSRYDTTATELRFINANLGPILKSLRIPPLQNRQDIDKMAKALLSSFGL